MRSAARIALPLYGLLLILGGVKGYQEGSKSSLYAGAGSGVLSLLFALLGLRKPRLGMALGALVATALTGVMGYRWEKSGRIVPAGMIAIASLLTSGLQALGAMQPAEG